MAAADLQPRARLDLELLGLSAPSGLGSLDTDDFGHGEACVSLSDGLAPGTYAVQALLDGELVASTNVEVIASGGATPDGSACQAEPVPILLATLLAALAVAAAVVVGWSHRRPGTRVQRGAGR